MMKLGFSWPLVIVVMSGVAILLFSYQPDSAHYNKLANAKSFVNSHVARFFAQSSTAGGINSVPGHTGSGVPRIISELLSQYGQVNEDAQDYFGAASAVHKLEEVCGWDPVVSNFKNAACLASLNFQEDPEENSSLLSAEMANSMDIVIPSIRDLDFLEHWREFIEPFHLILVQDGDPDKILKIPGWADYELYNRRDIEAALGKSRSWIISSKDASIRNFGFLVSRKKFIYTLDDDCLPATNAAGVFINSIAGHYRNLMLNSTPYFFNTLYDPYRRGSDFVRGYPYSLRDGVRTAISHGLWLNAPDYDAPTQLLKITERNLYFHDVVQTIPAGVYYPMCSMNVAFNRELIGPAFMQGLMGEGQPWARYDDMFAGWASKAVADHLQLGVKSGSPYIHHNKASNPFTNLKKEYKGLWWQETVISFFNRVSFSQQAISPQIAYTELANQIRQHLVPLHPYFDRLAQAMLIWVEIWDESSSGLIKFAPSRSSNHNTATAAAVRMGSASCLTYSARYEKCRQLRSRSIEEQRVTFNEGVSRPEADEVAMIRIGSAPWTEDYWLNVCSFVLESMQSLKRNVVLLAIQQAAAAVPPEFRPLVRTHDDEDLRRLMGEKIYVSGYFHGDLAASWFLKYHPQYRFAWVFEADVRMAGSYHDLFTESVAYGRTQKESTGGFPVLNPDNDAELLMWGSTPGAADHLDPAYKWWNERRHMHGVLSSHYPVNQRFYGAGLMGMGLSRKLAMILFENAMNGTVNDDQEYNTPIHAIWNQLKFVSVPGYGNSTFYDCCSAVSQSWYTKWKDGDPCAKSKLFHPVKL